MSFSRQSEHVTAIDRFGVRKFHYPGSFGTGDGNGTWNLETFQETAVADKRGVKLDFRDKYPLAEELDVYVNGVLQDPGTAGANGAYTVTEHSGDNALTVTFGAGVTIADEDDVAFEF